MTHPIPHWYKPSPLWTIPQDWEILEFKDVIESISTKKYQINSNEIMKSWDYIVVDQGNWLIAGYSNQKDRVCKNKPVIVFWDHTTNVKFVDFDFIIWADGTKILKNKKWDIYFLYSYLTYKKPKSEWYKRHFSILKELEIIFPPLPEQQAIASILSTCDESITTTQTFIDRLQQRHKALCQQLLTGKKRLQGFNEVFKKLQADEIFKNVSIKNNPWERLLSATQDQWIIPRDMLEWRVTMPTTEANSYKLVQPWNFVISLRSFQWWLEYSTYRGIVSPAYTVLEPILPINDDFYKYYFKSYDFIWHLAVAVIGIRDWKQISFDNFCALSLPYPSPEEQTAIASILNESQMQIDLAQSKLIKLKQHKQGLMQQLLTGKTRVPSEYL